MLYPVMPVYLKSIGYSVLFIGILEGFAEATAGLSKGYFGKRSDNSGKRVPFVRMGYALSGISKPLMAFFINPAWIFFSRTLDRFGKGIRTGARDAMLSDEATPQTKARVFGFHRSMDTLGAVLGPTLALVYLYFYPQQYKTLFLIAFLPGVFAFGISFLLKDKAMNTKKKTSTSLFAAFSYWKNSPGIYKKTLIGLLVFALFNSSDMFLLLKAKQVGLNDTQTIGIYIFYNLIYAIFAFPLGILADKLGLKLVFVSGLMLFAGVYAGMAFVDGMYGFITLFFIYGIYAAATEGISKALLTNITNKNDTATAIGTYTGFQSICTLLASSMAGIIWYFSTAEAVFLLTSIATCCVCVYFIGFVHYTPSQKKE
jgi:MFS family permease